MLAEADTIKYKQINKIPPVWEKFPLRPATWARQSIDTRAMICLFPLVYSFIVEKELGLIQKIPIITDNYAPETHL